MNQYRSRKDSDSEPEDERPVYQYQEDFDEDYQPKQKRESVWTDVAIERQLEYRGSNINLDKDNPESKKFTKVRRGAESYLMPTEETVPRSSAQEGKKEIPVVTVTPVVDDDPFGDTPDLGAVEEFGIGTSNPNNSNRGRGSFRGRVRRGRGQFNNPGQQDVSMDRVKNEAGEEGRAEGQKARGGGSQPQNQGGWMRGRGRGQHWQNRGGRGGYFPGQKRKWEDPSKLIAPDYCLETLMSTEFQQGIALDQLGKEIGQALGEKDASTVISIVQQIGEEKTLLLFNETREVETKGGMKTLDGTRRRTPGGVFISLFKADIDVSPEIKDRIFEESRIHHRRQYKQARKKNFDDKLQEVASLLEKEKNLKQLEDIADVVKVNPDPKTEDEEVKQMES